MAPRGAWCASPSAHRAIGEGVDTVGAVPKKKVAKGRRDRRRSQDALRSPHLVECPQCHEMRRPHHICPNCGHYRGTEVIEHKEEK
ncbi:MAG: 50S ribosomal protein L32 [Chloroflexi bacterium]|nr:50S ribosomal protein L32 [Chloroflexota bacterium]